MNENFDTHSDIGHSYRMVGGQYRRNSICQKRL